MTPEARHQEDTPVCPWCGHAERDWFDFKFERDGDERVVTCGKCEKVYKTVIVETYTFDSRPVEPAESAGQPCPECGGVTAFCPVCGGGHRLAGKAVEKATTGMCECPPPNGKCPPEGPCKEGRFYNTGKLVRGKPGVSDKAMDAFVKNLPMRQGKAVEKPDGHADVPRECHVDCEARATGAITVPGKAVEKPKCEKCGDKGRLDRDRGPSVFEKTRTCDCPTGEALRKRVAQGEAPGHG